MKNGSDERVDGGEAWEIAWGELRGKERYESDEAEGKPWEIVRKSSVGKERDGSDDKVDGWETVGNSKRFWQSFQCAKLWRCLSGVVSRPWLAASWKEGASMRIACKFCRLQALGQPCVAHVQASQTRIDPKMEGSKTRTPAASRTVVIVDKFLGLHGAMKDFYRKQVARSHLKFRSPPASLSIELVRAISGGRSKNMYAYPKVLL